MKVVIFNTGVRFRGGKRVEREEIVKVRTILEGSVLV